MNSVTITDSKLVPFTGNIDSYYTVGGYTKNCGVPTNYKVRIGGSNRWYRVYNYCTSNRGALFIKTKESKFAVISNLWDLKK